MESWKEEEKASGGIQTLDLTIMKTQALELCCWYADFTTTNSMIIRHYILSLFASQEPEISYAFILAEQNNCGN